jgi:hypothetical protein
MKSNYLKMPIREAHRDFNILGPLFFPSINQKGGNLMYRSMFPLVLVLLTSLPCLAQQSLVGTYKLVFLVAEEEGKPYEPFGKAPHGYLMLTPTHFIYFITAENRKFGTSVDAKAALLDSLIAYAGVYRVEGDKLLQTIEVSYSESEKRKTRVETLELSGNRLTLKVGPIPFPRDPSKTLIRRQVWEKIE